MSDGQYELYRRKISEDKLSHKIGDLEVPDNFTGRRRPVGSLSGKKKRVGIISYREQLMDNISQQICVKKTLNGSQPEMV